MEELVTAANSILRDRPSLRVQARTVRFYISGGLLPPPSGGPKFARYTFEHLRRIVSIRLWLDGGLTLDQAAERIRLGEHGGATQTHQRSQASRVASARSAIVPEQTVRRTRLTPHCVLEVDAEVDFRGEVTRAARALQTFMATLNDIQ